MRYPTSPHTPQTPVFSPTSRLADHGEAFFPSGFFYTADWSSSPLTYVGQPDDVAADGKALYRSSRALHLPAGLFDDDPHALATARSSPFPFPEQHRPAAAHPVAPYSQPAHSRQQSQPVHVRQQSQPLYRSPPALSPHWRPPAQQVGPPKPLGPAFVPYGHPSNGVPSRVSNPTAPPVALHCPYPPMQPPQPPQGRPLPWPPGSTPQVYRSKGNVNVRPQPPINHGERPPSPYKSAPVVRLRAASPSVGPSHRPVLAEASPSLRYPLCPVGERSAVPDQDGGAGGDELGCTDAVAHRVERTARSGFFLRECQRLARDFVACAEIVRIQTVEDHAAALETLVALGEIHGAVLQKLALGDFKSLRDVLPLPSAAETTVGKPTLRKSDSTSTVSLPSLSTSSSGSHLDSFAITSPARSTASATINSSGRFNRDLPPLTSPLFTPSGQIVERWVSHRAGRRLSDNSPTLPSTSTDPQPFYRLLLNRTTPLSAFKDSRVLSDFILRSLADPVGYKLGPIALFVKTVLRHVTTVTAGQTAARTFSRSAATLLLTVHQMASQRSKQTVPALLLQEVQPSLDALVDKVAIFLCLVHALDTTLVPSTVLHELLHLLLHTPEPTEKECFAACELFELAGQRLERQDAASRSQIETATERMKIIAGKASLTMRARFALQDMIDLKSHGWMTRAWMRQLRGRVEY